MSSDTQQLLILFTMLFIVLIPLFIGKRFDKLFVKVFLWILLSPYYIIKWLWDRKTIQRRKRNYEILGYYVALLGNNPDILGYFRELIEKGISEKDLVELIEANLLKMKDFEQNNKKEILQKKLDEEVKVKQWANEQQEILNEAKMSLEQIKFREKLLDGLYQKIRKKYRL